MGAAQGHLRRGGPAHDQTAIGGDMHLSGIRGHVLRRAHTGPAFGRTDDDPVGIHAAQHRRIDGDLGRFAAAIAFDRDLAGCIDDIVAPGHDPDGLAVDRPGELDRAGQQVELADPARIYAALPDHRVTARDVDALQRAGGAILRQAGGQGGVIGIDEAATVAGQAIGIGDDDIGTRAGDLQIAAQVRGVIGHDLVDDDPGGPARQVAIALNIAAKTGLPIGRVDIVQDRAVAADAETLIGVVRHAGIVGTLDHHHGRAGGGMDQTGRRRTAGRDALRHQRGAENGTERHNA